MESKRYYIKRPIVFLAIGIYLGIIGGDMLLNKRYIPPFFIFAIPIFILNIVKEFRNQMIILIVGICIGISSIIISPIHQDKLIYTNKSTNIINSKTQINIIGSVSEISENAYYKQIILEDVLVDDIDFSSNIKIIIESANKKYLEDSPVTLNDRISVVGEIDEIEPQMNPSDFDNEKYLLSQNISYQVKASNIKLIKDKNNLIERSRANINRQIDYIFNGKDFGIIRALTLGDDSTIDNNVHNMYMTSGIGHILCISGFHVGLIMTLTLAIISRVGIGYYTRYIITLLIIWIYAVFTGFATSTVRASIMITVFIGSRVLIEEEDNLISLALASIIILIFSPYQLFMPGFQLSFLAVLGVTLSSQILMRLKVEGKFKKWHATFIPWIMIQLATSIPLAYHFYEVPFISSFLNFIIIPIFSIILIFGWISIGISFININIAVILGDIICYTLNSINAVVEKTLQIPYSTILTGRPSNIHMIIYVLFIIAFIYGIGRYFKSVLRYQMVMAAIAIALIVTNILPRNLDISLLYVGQGDGTVIITPNDKVIVIDGGKEGKGKVISNYLKFRGKRNIDLMVLSHSDSDHIGGLHEILETPIEVGQVVVSKYDSSDALSDFLTLCKSKEIKVNPMLRGDSICLGETKIDVLAPILNFDEGNANDNSLVCHIKYKDFTALFTGDKSIGNEDMFYNSVHNLSVLKVSHHGSKTGTSKELLLKIQPLYAMISCGKNNSYGHPHKEVTNMLNECNVVYNKTSSSGAIIIETNGETMNVSKHREE